MATPAEPTIFDQAEEIFREAAIRWEEIVRVGRQDDRALIEGTVVILERAVELDQTHVPSWTLLSELLMKLGDWERVGPILAYLQSIPWNGSDVEAKQRLADLPPAVRQAQADAYLRSKWAILFQEPTTKNETAVSGEERRSAATRKRSGEPESDKPPATGIHWPYLLGLVAAVATAMPFTRGRLFLLFVVVVTANLLLIDLPLQFVGAKLSRLEFNAVRIGSGFPLVVLRVRRCLIELRLLPTGNALPFYPEASADASNAADKTSVHAVPAHSVNPLRRAVVRAFFLVAIPVIGLALLRGDFWRAFTSTFGQYYGVWFRPKAENAALIRSYYDLVGGGHFIAAMGILLTKNFAIGLMPLYGSPVVETIADLLRWKTGRTEIKSLTRYVMITILPFLALMVTWWWILIYTLMQWPV